VRQWLITNGFQGKPGQQLPTMTDAYIQTVSDRYIELYEQITGSPFQKAETSNIAKRIQENLNQYFKS
jgi:phosphoribosylaminoimidazole-succinocarboxamide synthase